MLHARGHSRAVRTVLRQDVAARIHMAAGPPWSAPGDHVDVERLGGADGDGPVGRRDVQHEPWLAVRRGGADLQATPLADGEAMGARMLAEHMALAVLDLPRRLAQRLAQEPGGVAVGDEADVVAVRFA